MLYEIETRMGSAVAVFQTDTKPEVFREGRLLARIKELESDGKPTKQFEQALSELRTQSGEIFTAQAEANRRKHLSSFGVHIR